MASKATRYRSRFMPNVRRINMEPLYARILNGKQKRLIGSKPLFQPHEPAKDVEEVEDKLGTLLPYSLKTWLAAAGYGDINENLSFRSVWFSVIKCGELMGHVIFAQDILGNFYSFSPTDGAIHFICRSAPEFAYVANDFKSFMVEFERREYNLEEWMDSLQAQPYNWNSSHESKGA